MKDPKSEKPCKAWSLSPEEVLQRTRLGQQVKGHWGGPSSQNAQYQREWARESGRGAALLLTAWAEHGKQGLTAKDLGMRSVNFSKAPLQPRPHLHEMCRNLRGFHIHTTRHQNVFLKLAHGHAEINTPISDMAKQCTQLESQRLCAALREEVAPQHVL